MTSTKNSTLSTKPLIGLSFSLAIAVSLSFTSAAYAQEPTMITIAKTSDAQIFAEFTDSYPAVLNYFSKASEEEIIAFYQQQYGNVLEQERKRGRLTMHFAQDKAKVRVVISQQNKKRQVDILIEK